VQWHPSVFNTDNICPACRDKERQHVEYKIALAAIQYKAAKGDVNFPGVGLPDGF
jgi:hypothetical protein